MYAAVDGMVAIGDPSSTRTVYAVVVALGAIGVLLVALAIWLIRQTKPEREFLAPLERMNDRSWRKKDPANQRRTLDQLRPDGAQPLAPEPSAPELDEEFEQPVPALASFDDLQSHLREQAEDGLATEPEEKTPAASEEGTEDDAQGEDESEEPADVSTGGEG